MSIVLKFQVPISYGWDVKMSGTATPGLLIILIELIQEEIYNGFLVNI